MLYGTTGGVGRLQPPSGRLPRRLGPPLPERRPEPWGLTCEIRNLALSLLTLQAIADQDHRLLFL